MEENFMSLSKIFLKKSKKDVNKTNKKNSNIIQ